MRAKPVVAAISIAVLLGAFGCTKTESPKEVDAGEESSATTIAEPDCPSQEVADDVNAEFDRLKEGKAADFETAMDTIGEYVPSNLQAQFEVWRDATVEVADLIKDIDPDTADEDLTAQEKALLAQAQEIVNDPKVDDAKTEVEAYFDENCPGTGWTDESDEEDEDDSSTTTTTEDRDETTTTEVAAGDCPTQDVVDAMSAQMDDMESLDGAEFGQAIVTALSTMDTYLPSDYDSDLDTLEVAYKEFASAMAGIDLNAVDSMSPEQQAALLAASQKLEEPAVVAAQERIQTYFDTSCPEIDF